MFKKIFFRFVIMFIIIIIFIVYENKFLVVSNYDMLLEDLEVEFNNYKILQLSDLHNANFGKNQKYLLNKIEEINPNIIVFTGDLVDYNRFEDDFNKNRFYAIDLIKGIKEMNIPMYMIYGNHDKIFMDLPSDISYLEDIKDLGVKILDSEYIEINKGNKSINLLGIHDPSVYLYYYRHRFKDDYLIDKHLGELVETIDNDNINILLTHRPELLDIYSKYPIDIALAGHAHGGQWNIPFIGGLYAPSQGKLPKYISGVHTKNNTNLIISRGLGNSRFPFRLNNKPELVVVNLKKK